MTRPRWYVVHSHPRREEFVRNRLQDLGLEAFLPMVRERLGGYRGWRRAPLFPGYVFARLSAGDLARVGWTPGVRRLLGDGERPCPVDDQVVLLIRERVDANGTVRMGRLRKGAAVRIVDGPLAGLSGVLEDGVSGPERRVRVLLELFHRPTRVEVSVGAVVSLATG